MARSHSTDRLLTDYGLAANRDAAEDLLQKTFVTAIEKAHTFEPGRNADAWIVGILVKHHRLERRRSRRVIDQARIRTRAAPNPGDEVVPAESGAVLTRAIDGLPEPYREVIRLHYHEGLEQGQIAARLGRPRSTISAHCRPHHLRRLPG